MRYSLALAMMLLGACSRENNLLKGRVEATVGTHTVVVTDCYRTSVPPPQKLADPGSYRFTPCRDADVLIRGGELVVNGTSYGRLDANDSVLVDHGVVSIHKEGPPR
jgi:hypothetical protein